MALRHLFRNILLHLVVFLNLAGVSRGDYETFVLDGLNEYCPYLSTCSAPAQQQFNDSLEKYMPCCQPCACNELCVELGNCCPDAANYSTHSTENGGQLSESRLPRETCVLSAYPDISNGYASYDRFTAIDSCPAAFHDTTVVQKCTATRPKTIEQVTLVSDVTDTIYRNVYCAQCNGARDVTRWILEMTCEAFNYSIPFRPTLAHMVRRGCVLISTAPRNNTRVKEKRCYVPDISTCNVTGWWQVYDEYIERACATESIIFLKYKTVYKNVFCRLCNNDFTHHHSKCLISARTKKGFLSDSLTGLLNFKSFAPGGQNPNNGCRYMEIYDPYSNACRELICPLGSSAVNGKCLEIFTQHDGFRVHIFFKVVTRPGVPNLLNEGEMKIILRKVNNHFIDKLRSKTCQMCRSSGFVQHVSLTEYILRLNVMTSLNCTLSLIDRTVESASTQHVSNMTNEESEHISVERLEDYVSNRQSNLNWFDVDHRGKASCIAYSVELKVCPRIVISGLDYMSSLRKNYTQKTSHYDRYKLGDYDDAELTDIKFEICLSDYFPSTVSRAASNTHSSLSVGVFVFMSGVSILLI